MSSTKEQNSSPGNAQDTPQERAALYPMLCTLLQAVAAAPTGEQALHALFAQLRDDCKALALEASPGSGFAPWSAAIPPR